MEELEKQLELFKNFLRTLDQPADSPLLKDAREFIAGFPRKLEPTEEHEINALVRRAFNLPDETAPERPKEPFEEHIPKDGWLREYYEFTLKSEPPAVFHFMSSLTTLAAALERRVFFDKGVYKVFPNLATVLIAPTGKCRKTSATNIALRLAREADVNVLSERITPEALVQGLSGRETATGLLYAPELAVFLGRQRYLEGMVPLLTALFDSPDIWSSKTIGRGEAVLSQVSLCFLGASTMEWFVEALPKEAFSGGFMARILFVVQEETSREFALPEAGAGHLWERLRERLQDIKELQGEVHFARPAQDWYVSWYSTHRKALVLDEKFAGYFERKPDHLLRIAFLLRISETQSLKLEITDLERALRILNWLEGHLPLVFETVAETAVGAIHQRIIKQLRQAGGRMPHTLLLKRNQHILSARDLKEAIETLKSSETIIEVRERYSHYYELMEGKK